MKVVVHVSMYMVITDAHTSTSIHIALCQDGRLFVFGGVTVLDVKRTSSIYAIQVTAPSLKERCWQILTELIPDVEKVSKSTLAQLGVPRDLIQRIKCPDSFPLIG